MNCADLDILLCEYLDGTLGADRRAEVEEHLARCAACGELARDAQAALGFMERVPAIEPPPELMTRIMFELPAAHQARARKPGGLRRLLHEWVQPIMQPRFAMGFAMTILSFSLLARFAGVNPRQLTLDDLKPKKVWQAVDDRVYRTWQRTVKFYENIRLVYEIQTQLREWTQSDTEARGRAAEEQAEKPVAAPAAAPKENQTPGTPNEELRKAK